MTERFAKINNEMCMSVEAVAAAMGIEMTKAYNTIWKGLERNRSGYPDVWRHYSDRRDNRRKWIVISSLPEVTRLRVDYYYEDVELSYWTEMLQVEVQKLIDIKDVEYYLSIEIGGKRIEATKAHELAEACAWMRLAGSQYWKGKWSGRTEFLGWIAKAIHAEKSRGVYGLRVSSERSLRRKLNSWDKKGRAALLPSKYGNNNARKMDKKVETRILNLYSSPLKPSVTKVTEIYNREAVDKGWPTLTYERIRQVLTTPANSQIVFLARHGKEAFRNKYERTVKRSRPSFADALWSLDGTTIQLYYQKDGKVLSGLYWYAVIDVRSNAIIGYAIGASETSVLVQTSLRDAVNFKGMMPHQLQYDNSSANKSKEATQLFNKLARVAFPTAPYSGKTKPIEAILGRFEQQVLRYYKNFKGGNITSKSINTAANPELLKKLKDNNELPTLDYIIKQLKTAIHVHNNTVVKKYGKTPIEMYAVAHEKRRELPYLTMVDIFWVERSRKVRYTKDGLQMEVDKEVYTYEVEARQGVEDMEFRKQYLGSSFEVRYDPGDLEYINLYVDGSWIATARQKYEYAMAKADAVKGEGKLLKESWNERDEYIEGIYADIEANAQEDEGEIMSFQLAHKDALNRMEGEAQDELIFSTGRTTKRQKVRLYDIEEADGSLVDDNY